MDKADVQELEWRLWRGLEPTQTWDNCWLWANCTSARGYGYLRYRGRRYYTHRLAYELAQGLTPGSLSSEMGVLQTCHNHRCCEYGHLYLGKRRAQSTDGHPWKKGLNGRREGNPSNRDEAVAPRQGRRV